MPRDIHSTREAFAAGRSSPAAEVEKAIEVARSPTHAPAYLRTFFEEARATVRNASVASRPLAGLPVSIKDLFDIAGQTTAAGSVVLAGEPAARQDSTAVARLRAAGASLIGRTHMTEFAFSGVGTNPHFTTPANACDAGTPRIPGGSSSGAAVSVAGGSAFIGLGSDTGGSIRIPAALNGIVGFKNTARLTPLDGALPLSFTLDTVCAMTRSVRDAILAHEILADRQVALTRTPLSQRRLAVPRTVMLDGLEPAVARAFEQALRRLRAAGAQIDEIDMPDIADLGTIQAKGGFAAAESYAWHRQWLADHADRYDPRVATRIQRGASMMAHDYIDLLLARREWIARVERATTGFDALLSPTVPITAPPIASVAPGAGRDEEFFRVNGLLLRNPSVVNMLDGCAISLPCHAGGDLPVGLMVWHGPLRDDTVLDIALAAEAALNGHS
jgi:Asp-tRNA(Asn)/Glu-tRNA(Gln) amidotransferase A subunit family amidase